MKNLPKELSPKEIIESCIKEIQQQYPKGFVSSMMPPGELIVISIGDNPVSEKINIIKNITDRMGIRFNIIKLSKGVSELMIFSIIKILNKQPNIIGIILDEDLPPNIAIEDIFDRISPDKDIINMFRRDDNASRRIYLPVILRDAGLDNETNVTYNKIVSYDPTALAVILVINHYNIEVVNKLILIITDKLYEDNLLHTLRAKGADVIIVNDQAHNIESLIHSADIVISLLGRVMDADETFTDSKGEIVHTFRDTHILIDGCSKEADFNIKAVERCLSYIPYSESEDNNFETLKCFAIVLNVFNAIHVHYLDVVRKSEKAIRDNSPLTPCIRKWLEKRKNYTENEGE